jgi:hypothetical protein
LFATLRDAAGDDVLDHRAIESVARDQRAPHAGQQLHRMLVGELAAGAASSGGRAYYVDEHSFGHEKHVPGSCGVAAKTRAGARNVC